MAHSAAAELIRWTENRAADIASARIAVAKLRQYTNKRDRAIMLSGLHSAINCVRISNRMIRFEAEQLSLCPCGNAPANCTCVAPF